MSDSLRWRVALIGVVTLVLLGGCLSMSVEIEVGNDGQIDSMDMEMTMDEFLYNTLESNAQEEGYDSVEESLTADIEEEAWDSVESDVTETDDGATITISATGGNPDELEGFDVTVEEDSIEIVIVDGFNQSDGTGDGDFGEYMDQIEMEYLVHMPGEITDTNGEIQDDGESVRWTLQDHSGIEDFEATSERSQDDGESDSIPGFGGLIAIGAIALIVLSFVFRRR